MSSAPDRVLLVLTNFRDEGCGVGSSEAVVADLAPAAVEVLQPLEGSLRAFAARARRALVGARGVVVAYPTIDQHERLQLIPRLLLLRLLLHRRRWFRVHLHEFDHLRRRQRVVVAALCGLVADRVVVSSSHEAAALRTRYRGWAGRREVTVVPPANAAAPTTGVPPAGGAAAGAMTVGLIGQHRPDKNEPWLFEVLGALAPGFARLEVVGRGWDAAPWPDAVRSRYELVFHGHVPTAALTDVVSRWDLALAPFDHHVHDGRLSLRTPLAHGVPTLTPGPRPAHLQLAARHLRFDDEVDPGRLDAMPPAQRAAGAAEVAALEQRWRAQLVTELYGP